MYKVVIIICGIIVVDAGMGVMVFARSSWLSLGLLEWARAAAVAGEEVARVSKSRMAQMATRQRPVALLVPIGVGRVVSESGIGLQAGGISGKCPTGTEVGKIRVGGEGRHVLKATS